MKTSRISTRFEDLHIANFCLNYLNFGCFDATLTDLEIREFLRQGYYSFEDYAIAHWLDHVDSSTSQTQPSGAPLEAFSVESLVQRLESFLEKHGTDLSPALSVPTNEGFQSIREWDVSKRLDGLAHLARRRQSNEDYLDLETQLRRRRSICEDIVTNLKPHRAPSQNLWYLNGPGWFKCPKIWCEFFSDGFQHKDRRDKHFNQHERPFRCSFEQCLYEKLGYETERDLKRHEKTSHPTGQGSEWAFPTQKPKKKLDIVSASAKGDLATVERLVTERADVNQRQSQTGYVTPLFLAVKNNHPEVVRYLIRQGSTDSRRGLNDYSRNVLEAVNSSTTAVLQMVLDMSITSKDKNKQAGVALQEAAARGREDLIPLLLTDVIDINEKSRGQSALQVARKRRHYAFAQILLDNGALDEEPEPSQPATPTPATPITPLNANSFAALPFDFEQYLSPSPDTNYNFDPTTFEEEIPTLPPQLNYLPSSDMDRQSTPPQPNADIPRPNNLTFPPTPQTRPRASTTGNKRRDR